MVYFIGVGLFVFFGVGLLFSAAKVILANNPVEGVLYLLLALFNASGLLFLEGGEYFAFLLIMIYAGAIMVLFLFVVMMLNPRFVELQASKTHYYSMLLFLLFEFFLVLYMFIRFSSTNLGFFGVWLSNSDLFAFSLHLTTLTAIALSLFSIHFDLFLLISIVLLVSMIGAILLASHLALLLFRNINKKERLYLQVATSYKNNVVKLS